MTNLEAAEHFVLWCRFKRVSANSREWPIGAVFAVLSWKHPDQYGAELQAVQDMCGIKLPVGSAERLQEFRAQVIGPESAV